MTIILVNIVIVSGSKTVQSLTQRYVIQIIKPSTNHLSGSQRVTNRESLRRKRWTFCFCLNESGSSSMTSPSCIKVLPGTSVID